MRIKQSFCYPLYKPEKMTLDEFFAEAAGIGFAAVEFWRRGDDFETIIATARKHKLVVASFTGHDSLKDGLTRRANHDRIEAELRASLDVAERNGIPGLICLAGSRQPFVTEQDAIETVADGLRRVAEHAVKKGVNLNLEVLNSKIDHPGYQADHTAWGLAVVQRVNCPRVKLLYDIYHMQIMEGDVIRTIRDTIGHIGHFHTGGVPGRSNLDDTQELNYAAISKAIAQTPYDLYIGHEFSPSGDRLAGLRQAFAACDQQ